jgi:predicted Rossmann fold flavoprotein
MLLAECASAGVEIRCNARVLSVTKEKSFHLTMNGGELTCDRMVIATGGLSFAKLGATDFGHRTARQFGLRVTPLRPALVPLTFPKELADFGELSGVAIPTTARCGSGCFEEAMLFTHRGISGPAVLQISSYWRERETIAFDLLPDPAMRDALVQARSSGRMLARVLADFWPKRLVEVWCKRFAPEKPLVHYKQAEFEDVMKLLRGWPFTPSGTESYPKAEVTLGGVDTAELSSKTMEARKVPGLYFIGEVVDVTGWLGGYNFQWAWASAYAAGTAV